MHCKCPHTWLVVYLFRSSSQIWQWSFATCVEIRSSDPYTSQQIIGSPFEKVLFTNWAYILLQEIMERRVTLSCYSISLWHLKLDIHDWANMSFPPMINDLNKLNLFRFALAFHGNSTHPQLVALVAQVTFLMIHICFYVHASTYAWLPVYKSFIDHKIIINLCWWIRIIYEMHKRWLLLFLVFTFGMITLSVPCDLWQYIHDTSI